MLETTPLSGRLALAAAAGVLLNLTRCALLLRPQWLVSRLRWFVSVPLPQPGTRGRWDDGLPRSACLRPRRLIAITQRQNGRSTIPRCAFA